MSSDRRRRFNLRTQFSIFVFLTFLPRNLNTQEVIDSSQDYSSIQSQDYGNRRSLIDTSLPGRGSTLVASPPSPVSATSTDQSPPPPPTPPGTEKTPSPPSSTVPINIDSPPPASPLPPPPSLLQSPPPPPPPPRKKKKSHKVSLIVGIVVGVFAVSGGIIIFFLIFTRKIPIKPWTSPGQLQDSLITANVPKLQLSELQAACEDFSNIIGSFSDGTIYKGTLSTGAEVAVISVAASSPAEWSSALETQFLQKMHKLSKVDHKNFLNVIGYCHEEEPFNRMLVFEYAPNGSLFEHLHSPHTEHLDWPSRLRIVMGIAYCVEHLHNLNPPILHINLDSSSIYLTEDNAAKLCDFSVINSISPSKEGSSSKSLLEPSSTDSQTNLFNFGALVFEIISGKFPDSDSLLLEPKPARDLVDPTLKTFQEDVVERLLEVIRQCMNPFPAQRPTMREVVVKLREITGIAADAAMPRLSPRWWTEMEILST